MRRQVSNIKKRVNLTEAFERSKPKYKDLRFPDNKAFEKWLKEKTKYKITFADDGQDFSAWWLDKCGEVLHSDLQTSVWVGTMVYIQSLRIGNYLRMKTRFDNEVKQLTHAIETMGGYSI